MCLLIFNCYVCTKDYWRYESVHHLYYSTTKTLQDIFGTAILVQFGIGGWILCMAAYKIVNVSCLFCGRLFALSVYLTCAVNVSLVCRQLSVLSIEFASMTLFICCILTELFLYCYYGNEVTVEVSIGRVQ